MDVTASSWLSIMPILGLLFYLVPAGLIVFAIIKFYKLLKEKNEILKEISSKLDKLNK